MNHNRKIKLFFIIVVSMMIIASAFIGRFIRSKLAVQTLSPDQVDYLIECIQLSPEMAAYVDNFETLNIAEGYIDRDSPAIRVVFPAVIEEKNNIKHDIVLVFEEGQYKLINPTIVIYGAYPPKYKKILLNCDAK